MTGTLFIVSTPIGNLEDITFRAVRTLNEVGIIAAEDTRRTQKLCTHYNIHTPLTSYHDFNKEDKTPILIARLEQGENIAIVSDAGTPLVSDPGYFLVRATIKQEIPVVPIPGASSILAALTASGLPPDAFVFQGFLPRKSGQRTQFLTRLANEPRTIILFETPYRIRLTLEAIQEIFGSRQIVIARELTKLNESFIRGTAEALLKNGLPSRVKGEITVLIEGFREKHRVGRE
ncbi:MAG: 16S rRNA (cytidine(1402)-2'-O)-methyltransferase [Nitrospirales bacterium]|nr:16S rRNA (cytidine(1402)-2'-O)-methyltransferase [Nitrospira sp.]MDR4500211.1 16S rRNA (cytidine(1402)-2'-O)-methyltransferase [Nitrospirales bacterium]